MATDEQSKRLPQRTACPLREVDFTNLRYREALGLSQEPALNHCVIDVFVQGSCDFLCFLGVTGFHFFSVAFAVEGDNLDLILFVAAVCVCGDDANVCHDFEVFDGLLLCAGARFVYIAEIGRAEKVNEAKISR